MSYFILRMSNTDVSSPSDSFESIHNPIYTMLDSTNTSPSPSAPVELELSLSSGFYCENAEVYFRGTTSNYWEVTNEEPTVDTEWHSSITTSVDGDNSAVFYVRSNTAYEEVGVLDSSSVLEINGDVRCR